MRDFYKEFKDERKSALIIGKGPSFREPNEEDRTHNIVVGLNHVPRETRVDLAHIIDTDVLSQIGEKLYNHCKYLVMPYFPHTGWRPNNIITLKYLCEHHPIVKKLNEESRLLAYNLSTTTTRIGDSPVVKAKYYSAEAAVSLLAQLGVKRIQTLGIDGGRNQSANFSDLTNFNKERGYDLQWEGIRNSIKAFGLNYSPLGIESPIRIFVGAGEEQLVPAMVLKHSIMKHVTMSCEVTPMIGWKHPMPKDRRNWPRTPFSFQRFMIPEKCNYEGHAIYMDSDMLVFGDVKDIWTKGSLPICAMRFDDVDKHKAKYSVIKIDCESVLWNIDKIVGELDSGYMSYEKLVFDCYSGLIPIQEGIDLDWNSLEEYTEGKTKLLHYTEMYNQPWLRNPNHPLGHLWFNELTEAVKNGSIDLSLVEDHVNKGWILSKCMEVLSDIKVRTMV